MSAHTPARSATTACVGTGPSRSGSFSSRASRILARRTSCAGCDPVRTSLISALRSAGLNTTGRDFVLDITDSLLAGGRGRYPARGITPQDRQLEATLY